jgi:hypothetical protein
VQVFLFLHPDVAHEKNGTKIQKDAIQLVSNCRTHFKNEKIYKFYFRFRDGLSSFTTSWCFGCSPSLRQVSSTSEEKREVCTRCKHLHSLSNQDKLLEVCTSERN